MQNKPDPHDDDLQPEYDFPRIKRGVRGKYTQRFNQGSNLTLLDPDAWQRLSN